LSGVKDLAKSFYEPTAADFGRLSRVVKKYKKIYEEQFDDIRNKYVAQRSPRLDRRPDQTVHFRLLNWRV